jgi:thiol:disulfide interchange protein
MKKFLFALIVVLTVTFAASAQKTASAPAKTPAPTPASEPGTIQAEKKSAVIEREKFDPAKNPADDLKKAVEQASAEGKRIILDLGGEWCVWCRYMDRFFNMNADLEKIKKENFVWVKINVSEDNENKTFLSAYPEATGYPHFYVLDEKGQLLKSQSTDALESPKGYDLQKFTDFLKKWSPPHKEEQKADAPAVTH